MFIMYSFRYYLFYPFILHFVLITYVFILHIFIYLCIFCNVHDEIFMSTGICEYRGICTNLGHMLKYYFTLGAPVKPHRPSDKNRKHRHPRPLLSLPLQAASPHAAADCLSFHSTLNCCLCQEAHHFLLHSPTASVGAALLVPAADTRKGQCLCWGGSPQGQDS